MNGDTKRRIWLAAWLAVPAVLLVVLTYDSWTSGSIQRQAMDAWIVARIKLTYLAAAEGPTRNVRVTATNGLVTLSGSVPNERAHREALAVAKDTRGATAVIDLLSVDPEDLASHAAR